MKKIAALLVVFVGLTSFAIMPAASAYDPIGDVCTDNTAVKPIALCTGQKDATTNPLTGPNGAFRIAANVVAILAGIVAVISIILAGFRYITSGGDPSKVKGAKDALVAAVIGVTVVALAQSIIIFILSRL